MIPIETQKSPLYFVATAFQIFAILFSIYSLYRVSKITITSKGIRIFLNSALIGSIISQCYSYYHYNYDMGLFSFGILFLAVDLTLYTLILIDFIILGCYHALNERITDKLIRGMRISYTLFFLLCHAIGLLYMFGIVIPWQGTTAADLQELLGTLFVFSSVIYDNIQVCYLTYLVYSTKKNFTDRRIVNESLKKTVRLNILVCGMDWIAMGLFSLQLMLPISWTNYYLQSICASCVAIHISLVIFIFDRLKEFTFVGVKRKAGPVAVAIPLGLGSIDPTATEKLKPMEVTSTIKS
jgi:hypothetical protein